MFAHCRRIADITNMDDARSRGWPVVWKHCLALVVLAVAVRGVGLDFGLPYAVARPDEEALVGNALRLEEVGNWNPSFFSYPSLMIYAAYGSFKLLLWEMQSVGATDVKTINDLFFEDPAPFHLVLRAISVICGSLTAAVVYLTARQLFGGRTALLAGLVICLCYLHARDSHFGVTDVPCVFLVCLSFWQLAKLYRWGRTKHLIWASVLAGLAIGTKYTGAWLCWPFAVAIVGSQYRRNRRDPLFSSVAASLLAIGLTIASFAATSPYFFLDSEKAVDHFTVEMLLLNAEQPLAEGISGYVDHFRVSLAYGLGWPVLLVALVAGVWMAFRHRGKALMLWSLPVLFYLFTGRSNRVFIRYMDIVLPFMAIACAWGVRSAYVALRCRRRTACRRVQGSSRRGARHEIRLAALPVVITVVLLIPSILRIWAFDRIIGRTDTRSDLRAWMLANIPPQDVVLWSGGWSAMPYMIHHRPIRMLDATEKLRPVLLRDPNVLFRYRWIVLVDWPRAYYLFGKNTGERAFLASLMAGRYELVHRIDTYKAGLPPELFSLLDHFYMSYQQPDIIDRPGPGFRVYRRLD
ncbi:MAG: glycosyltransferase family 39 protein [Phycisphaerae bacterium]|nr:glycosyltransferase family 39 protein [Phycisphaerae bacterium]